MVLSVSDGHGWQCRNFRVVRPALELRLGGGPVSTALVRAEGVRVLQCVLGVPLSGLVRKAGNSPR